MSCLLILCFFFLPCLSFCSLVFPPRRPYAAVSSSSSSCCLVGATHFIKIEIHSSCEIEYFVETHLCKLCV